MSTTSKVLSVLFLLLSLGFFYLSAMILRTNENWHTKVTQKVADVEAARAEVDALQNGSEEGQTQYSTLKTNLTDAREEFLNSPVIADQLPQALAQLKALTQQGDIDATAWENARAQFVQVMDQFSTARQRFETAQETFIMGGGGESGIRGIVANIGVSNIQEAIRLIQVITTEEQTLHNRQRRDWEQNILALTDIAALAESSVETVRAEAEEAERQAQFRTDERDALATQVAQAQTELDQELAKLNQMNAELRQQEMQLQTTRTANMQLVADLNIYQIQWDRKNGDPAAILTENGTVPKGNVENVSESDGSISINLGRRDGVRPGAMLQVYRTEPNPEFLGILQIESAESNKAVGRMLRVYRQRDIQAGDIVSSEISLQ